MINLESAKIKNISPFDSEQHQQHFEAEIARIKEQQNLGTLYWRNTDGTLELVTKMKDSTIDSILSYLWERINNGNDWMVMNYNQAWIDIFEREIQRREEEYMQ